MVSTPNVLDLKDMDAMVPLKLVMFDRNCVAPSQGAKESSEPRG